MMDGVGPDAQLTAELLDGFAIVSLESGDRRITSQITPLHHGFDMWPRSPTTQHSGRFGVLYAGAEVSAFGALQLRQGQPSLPAASAGHYGLEPPDEIIVPRNIRMLDAYRPEFWPTNRDWVLVLEDNEIMQRRNAAQH
jgi:hypothetical protein